MQPADKSNLLRSEAELKLEQARKDKAERIKELGSPIEIPGIALAIEVRDSIAWIAENTTVIRKLDLLTGKTLQLFRGHTAPVTSLTFVDRLPGSGQADLLVTGSWDKTIKIWNTQTKDIISSTDAHSDFVKALHVIPSLRLLVSSGSDKVVRLWDLSTVADSRPLTSIGTLSDHSRPVESLQTRALPDKSVVLYTGDTMGVIKLWKIAKDARGTTSWLITPVDELKHHRTRVNDMIYGDGLLWTASADETAQIVHQPSMPGAKPIPPIQHNASVKAILPLARTPAPAEETHLLLTGSGDAIRLYDLSTPEEPEFLAETDAHSRDVTALRYWSRPLEPAKGPPRSLWESWIVSTSLDGTLRRWKLTELLHPPPPREEPSPPPVNLLDEDEERELADLMGDD
uniref:WD-repeat protein n=1 Tax=Polyporus umbellatus TaxID=158314 RepID=A0A160HKQ5_9APHY|nr:WD-repeat protein [Polyporus umbellatus]